MEIYDCTSHTFCSSSYHVKVHILCKDDVRNFGYIRISLARDPGFTPIVTPGSFNVCFWRKNNGKTLKMLVGGMATRVQRSHFKKKTINKQNARE